MPKNSIHGVANWPLLAEQTNALAVDLMIDRINIFIPWLQHYIFGIRTECVEMDIKDCFVHLPSVQARPLFNLTSSKDSYKIHFINIAQQLS